MKDPMTKKQRKMFEELVVESWRTEYERALRSGMFPEQESGSFLIAKIAVITMGDHVPLCKEGKSLLRNWRA